MKLRLFLAAMVALSSTVGLTQTAHANQWDASWDTGNWFKHKQVKDCDDVDYGTYGVETIYSNGFAFMPAHCGGFVVDSCGRKIDIGPWLPTDYTYGNAPLYGPRWF